MAQANITNGSSSAADFEDTGPSELKPIIDYLLVVILVVVMLAMGCEITLQQELPPRAMGEHHLPNVSLWNATEAADDFVQRTSEFKPVIDYLLLVILVVVMLAMGCEITWRQLLAHMKKPIGICIGMLSQFVIVPLSAYALIQGVGVGGLYATGILIISCCPGGVLSNAFTYFCDGDLSLSVAMTTFSTLLAMGMMPLNVWVYGRSFETQDLVIPYDKLAISLISVTSPVVVGMLLRWKVPRIASIITKVGGYIGIFVVIICIILEVIVFPNMFTGVPAKLYGVVLTLPVIGLTLGFCLAWVFKQNIAIRKTIAIECGVQNVPTALTIISLSFEVELQEDIILLPWLYGFAMMTGCTVICITYQIYRRLALRKAEQEKIAAMEKDGSYAMKECTVATISLSDDVKTMKNGTHENKLPGTSPKKHAKTPG